MVRANNKFAITILVLFFLTSIAELLLGSESKGFIYGALVYLFFIYSSQITKYDYIFAGSLVFGLIIYVSTIFYKNIALNNWISVWITGLALFIYFKKGMNHK